MQTKHIKMDAYFLYLTSKLEKLRTGPERSLLDMKREILSWDLWRGTLAEGIATMLFVFIGTASIVFPIGEALTSAKIVKVSLSFYGFWIRLVDFSPFPPRVSSCLLYCTLSPFRKKGSTLKEKNLLPWEQILFFKNRPLFFGRALCAGAQEKGVYSKRKEFAPLGANSFL